MSLYPGRVGLVQRVLPDYRAAFFDLLAEACQGGLSLFAGQPRRDEAIRTTNELHAAHYAPGRNLHFFQGRYYLCWQRGLLPWLRAWNPDALIVEANPRYLSTPAALRWMQARSRPVIAWGLGAPPLQGPLAALRRARRQRFLSAFDAVIAYSQRGAEQYRALGLPPERVFVAHNAVAFPPAGPPPERPDTFDGPPTVLFVGRLQARKRVDFLLQACAQLPEELQPRLLVVGDGPAQQQFQQAAEETYPQAEFLGRREGRELAELFRQADMFVLPGTGGLAVQQAMAYALPVIAGKGDGTQDDLVRPENGWQVPPDNVGALTAALQAALSDPAALRAKGAASFRIVRQEINLQAMAAVFVDVLNKLR